MFCLPAELAEVVGSQLKPKISKIKYIPVSGTHLWSVVRVVAGVGAGAELLAVRGVQARHEAVVGEHLVKILDPAAWVKFLT